MGSETTDSASPNPVNSFRNSATMLTAVLLFIIRTSIHFEWLSTITSNMFVSLSVKWTCTLCNGRIAQGHRLRYAAGGAFLRRKHSEQLRTISSMLLSMHGHHMKIRTMDFILIIPGCIVFIYWNRCSMCVDGMTNLLLQTMHPSLMDSSSFRTKNVYSSSSLTHDIDHPCRVYS